MQRLEISFLIFKEDHKNKAQVYYTAIMLDKMFGEFLTFWSSFPSPQMKQN